MQMRSRTYKALLIVFNTFRAQSEDGCITEA
jgi:hypothetical protein